MTAYTALFETFPLAASYSALREGVHGRVREGRPAPSDPPTERHLQGVWFDPTWRPAVLRSADGERIAVEDPGRWNLEAGPDFLDATLVIGPERRRVRGDVEVHVRPDAWQRHGHTEDPRYARVVCHVTYRDLPALPDRLLPPGTVRVALQAALAADPSFSFESIDVTAYPYGTRPRRVPPCAELLSAWPPDRKAALLESAGQERLRVKACRIAARLGQEDEEQVLYEELMAALGYKHNCMPFRRLARRVPVARLRDTASGDPWSAYALLLGVAGLLPGENMAWDTGTRRFVRRLWDLWWKRRAVWDASVMPASAWRRAGLRPQNHPLRRLAAAASLFTARPGLGRRFGELDTGDARAWFSGAQALLQADGPMSYWRTRLSLGGKPGTTPVALLGARRTAAILSNVIVPYVAARGRQVALLLQAIPREEGNRLIRQTAFLLFGRDHNPALYRTGLRQQGLMQIFHDFCLVNRSSCRDCKLVQALAADSA
jgi:hypothetical protein